MMTENRNTEKPGIAIMLAILFTIFYIAESLAVITVTLLFSLDKSFIILALTTPFVLSIFLTIAFLAKYFISNKP